MDKENNEKKIDEKDWLFYANLIMQNEDINDSTAYLHLHKIGILALFPTFAPTSQEWVNSHIRRGDVDYALKRCIEYLEQPTLRYWKKILDGVNGKFVEECSPFTHKSIQAADYETAELIFLLT